MFEVGDRVLTKLPKLGDPTKVGMNSIMRSYCEKGLIGRITKKENYSNDNPEVYYRVFFDQSEEIQDIYKEWCYEPEWLIKIDGGTNL